MVFQQRKVVRQVFAGDQGQLRGGGAGIDPEDTGALSWLADLRLPGDPTAEIGRRDPVLALDRKDVVDHVEQLADLNFHAVFFIDLAAQGVSQPFPNSTEPPGNSHRPRSFLASGPRWARKTRPSPSRITAPTPTPM